jgi:hypothetical protein
MQHCDYTLSSAPLFLRLGVIAGISIAGISGAMRTFRCRVNTAARSSRASLAHYSA